MKKRLVLQRLRSNLRKTAKRSRKSLKRKRSAFKRGSKTWKPKSRRKSYRKSKLSTIEKTKRL